MYCHVDLDSLWMVHWEDRRNVETGSHTGVSDWMSILCCVARMSRLLEFPDTACLKYFKDVGNKCDWVTSLRISPQTCMGLTAAAFAFSGPDVDCAGWILALLSFSVVEYNVVRNEVACGGPGGPPLLLQPRCRVCF